MNSQSSPLTCPKCLAAHELVFDEGDDATYRQMFCSQECYDKMTKKIKTRKTRLVGIDSAAPSAGQRPS